MSSYLPINDNNSRFDLVEIKTTECKIYMIGWVVKPYEPRLEPGIYRNEW